MVNYFVDKLMKKGIRVKPFNISQTDIGHLSMALVDAATVVIGSPTVLTAAHPIMYYAAYLVSVLKPKFRFASIIGSYSWKGKMLEQLQTVLGNLKFELLEPVLSKGHPKEEDYKALDRLAEDIYKRHSEAGLI